MRINCLSLVLVLLLPLDGSAAGPSLAVDGYLPHSETEAEVAADCIARHIRWLLRDSEDASRLRLIPAFPSESSRAAGLALLNVPAASIYARAGVASRDVITLVNDIAPTTFEGTKRFEAFMQSLTDKPPAAILVELARGATVHHYKIVVAARGQPSACRAFEGLL